MGVEWSPRRLAFPVEWFILVPGQPVPIAVIRRIRVEGQVCFRAVTWAKESGDRRLIGYYRDGDAAAEAVWAGYVDSRRTQHDRASRTHGGAERNGAPSARERRGTAGGRIETGGPVRAARSEPPRE